MSTDSPILPRANTAGKRISVALAVAVHLLLAGFLFYGVRWQTRATDVVEVELVRAVAEPAPAAPPVAVAPAPTPEPPPVLKPEPKPAPPPPKPDIAIKEKEKPKPPPKVAAPPRVDPFQEQLKRETEQLTQRKNLDNAAQELAQKQATQAATTRNKAIADYLGKIRSKIRSKIFLPPDIKGNPEAIFEVTQLPSGEVIDVKLKKSSGHSALDAAVERAIRSSSPLPKPEQGDVFDRLLNIPYRPRED